MTTEQDTVHGSLTSYEEALLVVEAAIRRELPQAEQEIGAEAHLDLLPGADSVRLMRVVAALERAHGIELEDEGIRTVETVGELTGLLCTALGLGKAE